MPSPPGRWFAVILLQYNLRDPFWDRDAGLFHEGFKANGVDSRFVALGDPAMVQRPDLVLAPSPDGGPRLVAAMEPRGRGALLVGAAALYPGHARAQGGGGQGGFGAGRGWRSKPAGLVLPLPAHQVCVCPDGAPVLSLGGGAGQNPRRAAALSLHADPATPGAGRLDWRALAAGHAAFQPVPPALRPARPGSPADLAASSGGLPHDLQSCRPQTAPDRRSGAGNGW